MLAQTEQAINRKLYAMGKVVQEKALTEVLVGERSGREYTVPKTHKKYRASRPGEPPASRTGDLRRSVRVGKVEGTALDKHIKVGSNLRYAEYLENLMDRKWLEPSVELSRPDHEAILRGDWGI